MTPEQECAECHKAYAEVFCPYKGTPDPWSVWQAAWQASRRAPSVPDQSIIEAVDGWFARNTGLGGCSDKDVAELAAIFAAAPQTPEAAPVQLPEYGIDTANHAGIRVRGYTEQQVRDLLAAAKVERKPLTADEIKEPKNGDSWRVEWWNESCRMMLPADKALDSFRSYKNGTMQFTLKQRAHGIGNT